MKQYRTELCEVCLTNSKHLVVGISHTYEGVTLRRYKCSTCGNSLSYYEVKKDILRQLDVLINASLRMCKKCNYSTSQLAKRSTKIKNKVTYTCTVCSYKEHIREIKPKKSK